MMVDVENPTQAEMERWLLEQGWEVHKELIPSFDDARFLGVKAVVRTMNGVNAAYKASRMLTAEELRVARIDVIEHATGVLMYQVYEQVRKKG